MGAEQRCFPRFEAALTGSARPRLGGRSPPPPLGRPFPGGGSGAAAAIRHRSAA